MRKTATTMHYWSIRGQGFNEKQWRALIKESQDIISNGFKQGIFVAGPEGTGEPVFSASSIQLNGVEGEKGDPFILKRDMDQLPESCNTKVKPYDKIVSSILAAAKKIAPNIIEISAYGDPDPRRVLAMKSKTANLIKQAASNPKARKLAMPLVFKTANLDNKEIRRSLVKLASTNPEYADLLISKLAADATYRDYVEKKRKKGDKPLSEEEWESRVKGKGDKEKGDKNKGEGKKRDENKKKEKGEEGGAADASAVGPEATVKENAVVHGKAKVKDKASVEGHAVVYGESVIAQEARVRDDAEVSGNSIVGGKSDVSGEAKIKNNSKVRGNAKVGGKAIVGGDSEIDLNAIVNGRAQIKDAYIGGNALVSGKAQIDGISVFGKARIIGGKWDSESARRVEEDAVEFGDWKDPAGWMIMMDDFNTRKLRETAFGELKAYREKKAKQTRRIRSWAELKQEFLQNAKDPETKKRVQKMSPQDFEVMMKSIATDDEIEAAMGEGGGGKKASDVTARFPAGKSVDVAKWLRENGHEEAAADWEKYEGKVEDLKKSAGSYSKKKFLRALDKTSATRYNWGDGVLLTKDQMLKQVKSKIMTWDYAKNKPKYEVLMGNTPEGKSFTVSARDFDKLRVKDHTKPEDLEKLSKMLASKLSMKDSVEFNLWAKGKSPQQKIEWLRKKTFLQYEEPLLKSAGQHMDAATATSSLSRMSLEKDEEGSYLDVGHGQNLESVKAVVGLINDCDKLIKELSKESPKVVRGQLMDIIESNNKEDWGLESDYFPTVWEKKEDAKALVNFLKALKKKLEKAKKDWK